MLVSQSLLSLGSIFSSVTSLPGCGEVNVFYTHTYVTQQGYDAALVEAQIFNHTRQLREAGYNVRAVWRGPEIPGTEMSFGVRGSQISDVITLFEGQ
ncbi:hypothetical protein FDENT_1107 [Fusarium denticulatum]|uniref:Uncharacterized protein n=1 Tax=Fusarium denticulatum TaxID=48507 RepID=A0A8H5XJ56_9HYPO|nr:hypothetical protein FDENT_1107 [Fusarium denticulatum]